MKTIGQIIDEIDVRAERYLKSALNLDLLHSERDNALRNRNELLSLRGFMLDGGTDDNPKR